MGGNEISGLKNWVRGREGFQAELWFSVYGAVGWYCVLFVNADFASSLILANLV